MEEIVHKRLDDLRGEMNNRFADLNQRLTTITWVVSGWLTLLTILMVVFKFLA